MKWFRLGGVFLLLFATAASEVAAHGKRPHGSGLRFGLSFNYHWSPWYERPYYVPVFVQRTAPPIYVERGELEAAASETPQPGYWYYCETARRYYPDVPACASGWLPVPPRPPARP